MKTCIAPNSTDSALIAALLVIWVCGCALPREQIRLSMTSPTASNGPLEKLQVRIHGDPAKPTLIYCPGLHGDWTLVSSFRAAVTNQFCFVEFTYPRNETWSLDDYAASIESALLTNGITHGWLLGESFGSQVVWAMLAREQARAEAGQKTGAPKFKADGVILAGGFVRHPLPWGVRFMETTTAHLPRWCLKTGLWVYSQYARFRHRQAPETLGSIQEFVQRRQDPRDQPAIRHRLKLIKENDPRPVARANRLPVYALSGLVDPLVPNPAVRRWLKSNCPGYRGNRMIYGADHNVLATAPRQSAEQVAQWTKPARPEK
jgi:pimeloyl-ACP methyl ester carboxylesterase